MLFFYPIIYIDKSPKALFKLLLKYSHIYIISCQNAFFFNHKSLREKKISFLKSLMFPRLQFYLSS